MLWNLVSAGIEGTLSSYLRALFRLSPREIANGSKSTLGTVNTFRLHQTWRRRIHQFGQWIRRQNSIKSSGFSQCFNFWKRKFQLQSNNRLLKRQVYVVRIYGLTLEEQPIRIRLQADATTKEVISLVIKKLSYWSHMMFQGFQSLQEANRLSDSVDDYILVEELPATSSNANLGSDVHLLKQRMLSIDEKLLDAVAEWSGASGRVNWLVWLDSCTSKV